MKTVRTPVMATGTFMVGAWDCGAIIYQPGKVRWWRRPLSALLDRLRRRRPLSFDPEERMTLEVPRP